MRCVYPSCENTTRTRGLCHGHYQTMRSYVRAGQADVADLEDRGLMLPKGSGGTKVTTGHEAFLIGSGRRGLAGRCRRCGADVKPNTGDYCTRVCRQKDGA